MLPHDKALALSAVEVELLRDVRSRLSRRAVSDKAQLALGAGFLQACERVGIIPLSRSGAGSAPADFAGLARAAAAADMAELSRIAGALRTVKESAPASWPAAVAAGVPQAVLSRRLALAGREPPVEGAP